MEYFSVFTGIPDIRIVPLQLYYLVRLNIRMSLSAARRVMDTVDHSVPQNTYMYRT